MAVEEGRILPIRSHKNARSAFIPLKNSTQAKLSYTPESASHHTGKGKPEKKGFFLSKITQGDRMIYQRKKPINEQLCKMERLFWDERERGGGGHVGTSRNISTACLVLARDS